MRHPVMTPIAIQWIDFNEGITRMTSPDTIETRHFIGNFLTKGKICIFLAGGNHVILINIFRKIYFKINENNADKNINTRSIHYYAVKIKIKIKII